MNGKDKISVIIPCYNVQKYIMRCFDSIRNQIYGFENLEVILIDDLSTDNTYKVVKGQVIAKTPFIGYLSQLCFSAVGIIVTVVIFAAGVAIMMYVNKISKKINTMVEQQTA